MYPLCRVVIFLQQAVPNRIAGRSTHERQVSGLFSSRRVVEDITYHERKAPSEALFLILTKLLDRTRCLLLRCQLNISVQYLRTHCFLSICPTSGHCEQPSRHLSCLRCSIGRISHSGSSYLVMAKYLDSLASISDKAENTTLNTAHLILDL